MATLTQQNESTDVDRNITAHVHVLMTFTRLSQFELAKVLGVSPGTMSKKLGESGPTWKAWELARLADHFGVEMEELTRPWADRSTGERMALARDVQGLTIAEVAGRAKVKRSDLEAFEADDKVPMLDQAVRIGAALGCFVETLVGGHRGFDLGERPSRCTALPWSPSHSQPLLLAS